MIYSFLKDFAGPIATIIASAVAAYFVHRQWRTAQQQADTAKDQLRYSLFEKRYAIYLAARQAIAITFEKRDEDKMPDELNALFLHFEESRFFFPDHIYLFLDQLRKDISIFLHKNHLYRRNVMQNTGTQSPEIRKVLLDEESALLSLEEELYTTSLTLPKTFGHVLAFPQLTGRAEVAALSNTRRGIRGLSISLATALLTLYLMMSAVSAQNRAVPQDPLLASALADCDQQAAQQSAAVIIRP